MVVCPQKGKALERQERIKDRARKDRGSREDRFRHTGDWKKMREHILHRDRRLCLCCLAELEGTELLARAICHELDHLDGNLYVDKVEGDLYENEEEE